MEGPPSYGSAPEALVTIKRSPVAAAASVGRKLKKHNTQSRSAMGLVPNDAQHVRRPTWLIKARGRPA